MRLLYHAGDRFVPGHSAEHTDTEDQALIKRLLGARHSDGSPIWTLEEINAAREAHAVGAVHSLEEFEMAALVDAPEPHDAPAQPDDE